jgi:uncharacterized phage protein (TIGR02218 family)
MTGFSEDFLAHLAGEATTVCHCWRLTRRDGTILGFTDHDRPLAFDGQTFEPEAGFTASEARERLGVASEASEIEGALSSERIAEADVAAGRYDGARVETLLVNWRDPTMHALLRSATIGRIVRRDGAFTAELESLAGALDRTSGRYFRKSCDAELGDARCGVDTMHAAYRATGAVVAAQGHDHVEVSGLAGFAAGWFDQGRLTWTSGAMSGLTAIVTRHRDEAGATVLSLRGQAAGGAAGDGFVVVAGCDKRFATCKAKFANALNFRGFPHLPGNDSAYSYVTPDGAFDGGPLVP